jgi:hypothetical protein
LAGRESSRSASPGWQHSLARLTKTFYQENIMAARIVGYALSKEQLQDIHAGADCPGGKLKRHKLNKVENQRNRLLKPSWSK